MRTLNPAHVRSVIELINRSPFFKHMEMRVTELDMGYSKVVIPVGPTHMNPFGGLHGGVFSSVIDTAAYWSAYGDLEEKQGLVTIDFKVDLLAPVLNGIVAAMGRTIKSGKTLFLAEARMFNEHGQMLAHGTSKLMVTSHKQTIHEAVGYLSGGELPHKFIGDSDG